jgi:hypothetical protein
MLNERLPLLVAVDSEQFHGPPAKWFLVDEPSSRSRAFAGTF